MIATSDLLHFAYAATSLAIVISIGLCIVRALKGPTVFDKVLAANTIGSLAILLVAVVGFLSGRPAFLDIGITYGLLNLIATLAVLKFWRYGDLGSGGPEAGDDVPGGGRDQSVMGLGTPGGGPQTSGGGGH